MSKFFYAVHQSDNAEIEINYHYDEKLKQAFVPVKDCEMNHYQKLEVISNVSPYVEGPSLFFYARRHSHLSSSVSLPTMIGGKIERTVLNFGGSAEYIYIPASAEPVRARSYKGIADWHGGTASGLSGEIIGWISDDDAAVTLKAETGILLGNVVIELESYQRQGWIPPIEQYQDELTHKE